MARTVTVGEPGAQGADVAGTQGIWVSTPLLAAVAAATVGFASDLHMPKVGMLAIGLWSIMLAAGFISAVTVGTATIKVAGAAPNEQVIIALIATIWAIGRLVIWGRKVRTDAESKRSRSMNRFTKR